MSYLAIIVYSYVIGSSSMSFYLSKIHKINLKESGSGNLGASNTMLLLGWKAGVLVGLHDFAKAVLAVNLAKWFFPELAYAGVTAGVSCVLGHIFPFYLRFKGGKGFASFLGMAMAMDWKFGLALFGFVIVAVLLTDYIVGGMVAAVVVSPVYFGFSEGSFMLSGIMLIATVVMLLKHQENFRRIYYGLELKFMSTVKGEHKKYLKEGKAA